VAAPPEPAHARSGAELALLAGDPAHPVPGTDRERAGEQSDEHRGDRAVCIHRPAERRDGHHQADHGDQRPDGQPARRPGPAALQPGPLPLQLHGGVIPPGNRVLHLPDVLHQGPTPLLLGHGDQPA
jgi:hypothetical protein